MRENLAAAGVEGRDVLMVGNNTKEDLAACQLGCEGFLVTDFLIDPVGFEVFSVRHGSMEKFADWVGGSSPNAPIRRRHQRRHRAGGGA